MKYKRNFINNIKYLFKYNFSDIEQFELVHYYDTRFERQDKTNQKLYLQIISNERDIKDLTKKNILSTVSPDYVKQIIKESEV